MGVGVVGCGCVGGWVAVGVGVVGCGGVCVWGGCGLRNNIREMAAQQVMAFCFTHCQSA